MLRAVYVLPNLVTTGSLFCGLLSIFATAQADYTTACYLILLAAILDALDGPVARITRTSSSFGVEYDSLSDLVSFGVAPAFLMYNKLLSIEAVLALPVWAPRMAVGACGLFAICGAIRLARFNVQASSAEKTHFTGMPIPAAAGTVVSTFLVIEQYMPEGETRYMHRGLLGLMVVVSYLMVSTYPFPSLQGLKRRFTRSLNSLITIVFVVFVIMMFKEHLPLVAWLVFLAYMAWTVIRAAMHKPPLKSYSPGASLTDETDKS